MSRDREFFFSKKKMKFLVFPIIATVAATPFLKVQNDVSYWANEGHDSFTPASAIIEKDAGAWNVLTHSSFPGYSVRVRNEETKLCDSSVSQVYLLCLIYRKLATWMLMESTFSFGFLSQEISPKMTH